MIKIPAKIEYIIETLQKNGFKAYIVGGCVRDSLMGIEPHDYDVTTNAGPKEVEALFEKTIPTGIKHGTVTVILDKTAVEVTTFRTEDAYDDNRHPKNVRFVSDIRDDLSRRDFTVNAMAFNSTEGLIDCFGGKDDLKKGILRAVGDPEKRFKEDALRILRLFRFACVLGFKIEENTLLAAIKTAPLLKNISKERIFVELYKTAKSGNFSPIASLLECNALEFLNLKTATFKNVPPLANNNLAFFIFLYYFSQNYENTLSVLKASNALKNYCLTLLKLMHFEDTETKPTLKLMLTVADLDTLKDYFEFLRLCKNINTTKSIALLSEITEQKEPYLISHLCLTGDDLKNMDISGKKTGEILRHLQKEVIFNPTLNTKEKLTKKLYEFIS